MATHKSLSVDIYCKIAKMLNEQIELHGELQRDNKVIWNGYLHKMDNEIWDGVISVMEEIIDTDSRYLDMNNISAVEQGRNALTKFSDYYDKVLDSKNKHLDHKKIAWKLLMAVRESYNRVCDIHLPNDNTSKITSKFGDIFE